ncbi:hypothetical protein ACFQ12_00480, partial [Methylobacterium trifolii]
MRSGSNLVFGVAAPGGAVTLQRGRSRPVRLSSTAGLAGRAMVPATMLLRRRGPLRLHRRARHHGLALHLLLLGGLLALLHHQLLTLRLLLHLLRAHDLLRAHGLHLARLHLLLALHRPGLHHAALGRLLALLLGARRLHLLDALVLLRRSLAMLGGPGRAWPAGR